ncbi:MAG TPA: NAD(P)-dependent oxidoreductase [Polyangiaceae bacterium]|nr:NAD(P)-dependent oxidoreductase [Polyangiaceae bacterium]
MSTLKGKTLLITGATRGIGRAIALAAARDGANIAVLGKTDQPHPKLPGTVHDVVKDVHAAGGRAIPCVADVRFEAQVQKAVDDTLTAFGGIDILVNNASAIQLTGTADTPMKRFDLMHEVNGRATYMCSKLCLQALRAANNPHILMLSPPLSLRADFFAPHLAYSLSKFAMSFCVLGLAAELAEHGIAVNALWPRTVIATAAVENLLGGTKAMERARKPEIVADAARWILTQPSRTFTGRFCLDEDVLREAGQSDFSRYAVTPDAELLPDLFI